MKLLAVLGVLAGAYVYVLLHTTNVVLTQTQQLNAAYQYVGNNSEAIANGRQ